MTVNFVDLKKQYETLDIPELMTELQELITTGQFVGGTPLADFEADFASYHGLDYAVGVGSGTDALIFALAGLGIGEGDEVIVPANTFIATALAVTHVGATPIFCDVNPHAFLIDNTFEKFITENTKAVMPVHLYGSPVDMDSIMEIAEKHNLFVVEDCAQAIGAEWKGQKVGTFGDAGCYSFYPAKNLGGLGQGGAIVTNNTDIVDKARCLGNVGRKEGTWYEYSDVGYNSRLDTINALFLSKCLRNIDNWNAQRRTVAAWYEAELADVSQVTTPYVVDDATHVYHLYELKVASNQHRDALQDFLKSKEINCGLHYPVPCHHQEVYTDNPSYQFVHTETLSSLLLSLPMHPFMTQEEVKEVCGAIKEYFA